MISVVIPVYKNTEQLVSNLKNNLRYLKGCEIIVVNDYPSMSLKSALREFSSIKLLENEKNLGFGQTVNIGVRNATGEYVVLLNSDVVLEDSSYKYALAHFEKDDSLFAVSFAQKEKSGETVGKNRIYFSSGFFQHNKTDNVEFGINGWAEGGACMVHKEKFLKLGGFDNLYAPFYWEDIDLSYNAWKAGYRILFDPVIVVQHHHESTIGKYFDARNVKKISYRNQLIFIWKNITDKKLCVAHTLFLIPFMLKLVIKGETSFIGALIAALTKLSTILERRRRRGNLFIKKDSAILSLFT